MKIKDLEKYSSAEKIILAEQLWDSISKENIELSDEVKEELDQRLLLVKEDKTGYFTWEEVKNELNKKK